MACEPDVALLNDDSIWLAWYFLNTIVTDEMFSVIILQSHQQHHAAPEVALTVRGMLLRRKFTIV